MATKPNTAPVGVSFKPSAMVRGGLINDVDVEILSAKCCLWTYPGTNTETCSVEMELQPIDTDRNPDGDVVVQNWSAGNTKDFLPDESEVTFLPQGNKTGLTTGSNWGMFINSLCDRGFPEDKIENDINFLVGLRAHFLRVPAPKRQGISNAKEDATVLCVDSIISLPWEKGKKGGSAAKPGPRAVPAPTVAGKAKPVAAAPVTQAEGGDDDTAALALSTLSTLVSAAGTEGLKVASLRAKAFKALASNADVRNDVLALYADTAWLEANLTEEAGFMFDGTVILRA